MTTPSLDSTPAAHPSPLLIGCAHGTRSGEGQDVVRRILDDVASQLDLQVAEAFVDVQEPAIDAVVNALEPTPDVQAVVVPLLLAAGYHVHHDIAQAIAGRPDIVSAPALGPDGRLLDIVVDRLHEAGVPHDATVVLAPAGSSDKRATADSHEAADLLRLRWSGPVRLGFVAAGAPSVADAVAAAREFGEDVVAVASYLLAPGHFQTKLGEAGADYVSAPLAPDQRIVDVVADRYAGAATGQAVGAVDS